MNKYAIIENNVIVNIAVASPEFAQEQGWVSYPEYINEQAVGIGWSYINGEFIPPTA